MDERRNLISFSPPASIVRGDFQQQIPAITASKSTPLSFRQPAIHWLELGTRAREGPPRLSAMAMVRCPTSPSPSPHTPIPQMERTQTIGNCHTKSSPVSTHNTRKWGPKFHREREPDLEVIEEGKLYLTIPSYSK